MKRIEIELRPMRDSDYEDYIRLEQEVYLDKSLLETESQKKSAWDFIRNDGGRHCAVVAKQDGRFLGCCAIKDESADCPEVSIEILESEKRKGAGYEAVCALMRETEHRMHKKCFLYKVEPDNYESLLLVRKLNGKPQGLEKNRFLGDRYAQQFEASVRDCIDDHMRRIAEVFGCEAETLVSQILVFRIEPQEAEEAGDTSEKTGAERICSERKISRAIRVFDRYMMCTELLDLIEKDPDALNQRIEEMRADLEKELEETGQPAQR